MEGSYIENYPLILGTGILVCGMPGSFVKNYPLNRYTGFYSMQGSYVKNYPPIITNDIYVGLRFECVVRQEP